MQGLVFVVLAVFLYNVWLDNVSYKVVIVDDRGSVYADDDFRRPTSWKECRLRAASKQAYLHSPSLTAKCVSV